MARLRTSAAVVVAGLVAFVVVLYLPLAWRQLAERPPQAAGADGIVDGAAVAAPTLDALRRSKYEALLAEKDAIITSLAEKLQVSRRRLHSFSRNASRRSYANFSIGSSGTILNNSQWIDSGGDVQVPSLFDLLPHLQNNEEWLQPLVTTGAKTRSAAVVIGIPHIRRPKESYLLATLHSLLDNVTSEERASLLIVLQVSEPWNLTYYHAVRALVHGHFREHLASGLIEIIVPPPPFYPDIDSIREKWGDSKQRTRWRIKQNLDYVFLMSHCASRGEYYLQLEDDIIALPGYVTAILSFAQSQENWVMLEFSSLGFIGKLFRSNTLASLIEFIALFYKDKPSDLLLFNYFHVRECFADNCPDLAKAIKRFKPPLFQHIGYESSLEGKVQALKELNLSPGENGQSPRSDPAVIAHDNPPATVSTNLKQYQGFSLTGCYHGDHAFWALNPQSGDFIAFTFPGPTFVARYRLLTGDESHPSDKAYEAIVLVLPANATVTLSHPTRAPVTWFGPYIKINTFDPAVLVNYAMLSLAEGTMPPEVGPITELRIAFQAASQNWFILKEVYIELKA